MPNVYSTSTKVLEEIPGSTPSSLDAAKVDGYIADASRFVDARLTNYAGFDDVGGSPATPALIEKITRLIAAHDCMVYMGEMRGDEHVGADLKTLADKLLDDLSPADGSPPRAMIDPADYDYSQTPPAETARTTDGSRPHALYRSDITRTGYPGEDTEDI